MKYWDPQASTKKKWEETYAPELQSRGLTQDFTGLSTLLLGQAQPAQFQTEEQTGYWWGSKYQDDGNDHASASQTPLPDYASRYQSNANAELPRGYNEDINTFGDYYNWYAATAESGKYIMNSYTHADDSICPAGWKLPTNNTDNNSIENLIVNYYPAATVNADITPLPISIALAGRYFLTTGELTTVDKSAQYWTSSSAGVYGSAFMASLDAVSLTPSNINYKANGFSVRCVES